MEPKLSNEEQTNQTVKKSADATQSPIQAPTGVTPAKKSKRGLVIGVIIAVVVALLAVTAYYLIGKNQDAKTGSSSQQSSAVLGQKDADDAAESVKKWLNAFYAGDSSTACNLVTDKYVKWAGEEEDTPNDCKGQVDRGSTIAKAFGVKSSDMTYSGRLEDGTVYVSVKWSGSEGADSYEMVKEGGVWKINSKIEVVSEEEKKLEARNTVVDEWNGLGQAERDAWYNADGTGGFDAYAKSKGVEE